MSIVFRLLASSPLVGVRLRRRGEGYHPHPCLLPSREKGLIFRAESEVRLRRKESKILSQCNLWTLDPFRLRVCEFFPSAGARPRLSGESRNPVESVRRLALIIGSFAPLGSGFRRSDEVGVFLITNSEAEPRSESTHTPKSVTVRSII